MEERLYLLLDSKGTPLANAVLESPPNSEVLQIRVLNDKVEDVAAHREIQLIGIDDSTPNRVGVIVRQREDQLVIQPTAALDANARENLRILIVKTQILRELPDDTTEKPLYASKFVDLIQDEEALIRKAVFSIQIDTAG